MSATNDTVSVARADAVMTLTLNRPDKLNAIDALMHQALAGALAEAGQPSVRAVVITGSGKGFCVGQDLAELTPDADVGDLVRRHYNANMLALRALAKPVITAVNGVAAGAGLSLAMAGDVRIASTGARFAPAFINIALVPDSGASYFVSRILGPARALEWMASGRMIEADEALAWGLVSELVEPDMLSERAAAVAADWAAKPTHALGMYKRLFDQAPAASLEHQLELEAEMQTEAAGAADFAEGVAAFREKRPPRFRGSA
jgi:2-(1,2-epoxy-1,2-dihydrophenyl)acetyl-CoA isomerase